MEQLVCSLHGLQLTTEQTHVLDLMCMIHENMHIIMYIVTATCFSPSATGKTGTIWNNVPIKTTI